jgi:two-component system, response regulator PdtaR
MIRSLRIVLADEDVAVRDRCRQLLPRWGHEVVATAANGRELVRQCFIHRPGLVITDIRMPDMDGIEAIAAVCRREPVPVVVAAAPDVDGGRLLEVEYILACLTKPINESDLGLAVNLAAQRFEQFQALRQEVAHLRRSLEDRKVIERAKGILMKKKGFNEEVAFLRLQRLARDRNRKLVDMAQMVILAEGTVEPMRRT